MKRKVFILLATALLPAAQAEKSHVFDTGESVTAEVEVALNELPRFGFLPAEVLVHNDRGAAATWNLYSSSGTTYNNAGTVEMNVPLGVPAGEKKVFDLLIPVMAVSDRSGGYPRANIGLSGPDVDGRPYYIGSSGGRTTVYVGMTPALATPNWGRLGEILKGKSITLYGSSIELSDLTEDWRGWTGLDCLWLTSGDYEALGAGGRRAMQDWVSQGGAAYFCLSPGEELPLDFREADGASRFAMGKIVEFPWNTDDPPVEKAVDAIEDIRGSRAITLMDDYGSRTPFIEGLGKLDLNVGLLGLFIAAFALVVGPLNLLWFARTGRRHRLFWTTPLISVGASALLVLVIVLQDGIGGSGARVVFTYLLPAQNRMVLLQEQAAKSGVLLSRSFPMPENSWLTPIAIDGQLERTAKYAVSGNTYSGDWFSSRALQAQFIEAIVPTRQSVELLNAGEVRGGAEPVLLSSIPGSLDHLYWTDFSGQLWYAKDVAAGRQVKMAKSAPSFREAYSGVVGNQRIGTAFGAGKVIDDALRRVADVHGNFIAVSQKGPFVATLPQIRWEDDVAIFAGGVVDRTNP